MNTENLTVEELVAAARLAEVTERFEDMCSYLSKLVETKCSSQESLTIEERNLFSVAYKNVAGVKRQSWRILSNADFKDLDEGLLAEYKAIIENELDKICHEVIDLLEKITKVSKEKETAENVVFYLKMSGDYNRYLSEFKSEESCRKEAEKHYEEAVGVAKASLPETNSTRLGLALNYSVCCYEVLDKKDFARQIAKEAFDSAIEKLDTLTDSSYKDSTLIMQLLRDNLALWTAEKAEQHEK